MTLTPSSPRRALRRLIFWLGLTASLALCQLVQAQTPEWIWHGNGGIAPKDGEVRYFRKSFVLKGPVSSAVLRAAGDNGATVYFNGQKVADNHAWEKPSVANVLTLIRNGENVIAIKGSNDEGEAALVAKLELTLGNGRKELVVTDTSWSVAMAEEAGWQTAQFKEGPAWAKPISKGKLGTAPWGDVMAPRAATSAEKLTTLPGFKVELIRSAEPEEGSWVSMAIDDRGRLIVSPQEGVGNMLRVTLTKTGQVEKMERIEAPLGSAMGLLWAFDRLYVSGAGPQGLGLYTLRDNAGKDHLDEVTLVKKFDGAGGEHGSHGLALGPDGKIYYMHGNFVKVPGDLASTSPHRNYADDLVLPRAEDGNGFGVGLKPPGGFLLRTDAKGRSWELVAAGMRNAYDFAFNAEGEMFTFDSDMEWDWGTPWYRPTRIYHLVSGGDYGFREGTAKWPEHYQDALPPVLNVGIGSPTGVKFGTGSRFPSKYQKALYAMDWAYGRIFAIHLQPNGGTYTATKEDFVRGTPLNVTDMEIGKDGAMYFTAGGRGTQAGLYRVSYIGNESVATATSTDKEGLEARALRHKLEALHGAASAGALDIIWPNLSSQDRSIRYAARIALERQEQSLWKERVLQERDPQAALNGLLALARVGQKEEQARLLRKLATLTLTELSHGLKLEKLRVLEVCLARQGTPAPELASILVKELDANFPSADALMNRELAQLLIRLQAPGVVTKTLALAEKAETSEDRIHYLFHLRNTQHGWSLAERRNYFGSLDTITENARHSETTLTWFKEAGRGYGDGASYPKFIANIRKDAIATLSASERAELASIVEGKPAPKQTVAPRELVIKEWSMDDLINAKSSGKRSFAKGREVFNIAQCSACHRFGNEGGAVGPDLTAIASRFTRRDLIESILEPSKVVSEQYQSTNITKKNGDEISGRILEETPEQLVLLSNPLTQEKTVVLKKDISIKEISKLSSMPTGLINVLALEEVLNLLAYLESGGNENHAAFK